MILFLYTVQDELRLTLFQLGHHTVLQHARRTVYFGVDAALSAV